MPIRPGPFALALLLALAACGPEQVEDDPPPDPVAHPLVSLLEAPDAAVRRRAAEGLGRLESPSTEVVRALVAAQHDEDEAVGRAALYALYRIRPAPDVARLPPSTRQGMVQVVPARTEWRKVACEPLGLAEGEAQGACWVLVQVPPVYEARTAQIQYRPEALVWRMVEDEAAEDAPEDAPAAPPDATPVEPPAPPAEPPAGAPADAGLGEVWCEIHAAGGREWRRNAACEVPSPPR